MAGNWTKLTAKGRTEDLDSICAVMSMIDNGIMIEDYSDFSFSGTYLASSSSAEAVTAAAEASRGSSGIPGA